MLKTDPCSTRTTTAAKDLEEKVGYGRTQGRKLEIFCGCGFGNRFGEIGVTMALAGDTRNGRMPSFAVEQGAGLLPPGKNHDLYSVSRTQNGNCGSFPSIGSHIIYRGGFVSSLRVFH